VIIIDTENGKMKYLLTLFLLSGLAGLLATATSHGLATNRHTAVSTNTTFFVNSGQFLGGATGNDVALGDLNGSGYLDAFVANDHTTFGEANQVWFNDGSGFFSAGPTMGDFDGYAVALGDLDGDGDLDAVVGGSEGNFVWINQGGAQGGQPGTFLPGALLGTTGYGVAIGDVNSSGHLDVLIVGNSNQLWLNNGDVTFTADFAFPFQFSRSVVLADLDGDGWPDAIIADSAFGANSQVWWNDGNWDPGPGSFSPGPLLPMANLANAVAVADLDNDGRPDIFLAGSGPNQIFWNEGQRTFSTAGPLPLNDNSSAVALADLDGDGLVDAVVGNTHAHPNHVWRNEGNRVFTMVQEFGHETGISWGRGLALGDLTGDGSPDLFEATTADDRVWFNDAASPPSPGADLALAISGTRYVPAPVFKAPTIYMDVTVHNWGPQTATAVTVRDANSRAILPGLFSQGSQGQCLDTGCEEAWLFGDLAPGESATVRFQPRDERLLFGDGVVHTRNTAIVAVDGLEPDPLPDNNRATFTTYYFDCDFADCFLENLFCRFSLPSAAGRLDSLMETAVDLVVYYLARDVVLRSTADGQRYVDLYDTHEAEIDALLEADATLEAEGIATLQLWEANLWALVTGRGDSAIIATEQVTAVDNFLTNLSAVASPELQQVIAEERNQLGPLEDYIGMTMTEARGVIIGYSLKLPLIRRD
jgi:hypothetical protein